MAYKFLDSVGLAHVFDKIKTMLSGKADINHTHNYAGSASVGGAANSADKLNTDAGSATNPVYFANGIPVKTTYTLGASVPSGAKFTDTTYTAMTASEATTGTATNARSITAKVLHDKINEVVEENAYTLPAASSTLGGVKTTSTVTSTNGLTACPIIGGVPYYKDTETTATLSGLGITATAAELNYTDGVTSNIQTQLNGKLSTSGTAAKATADASGNNIVSTYATKTELATALTTDEIDEILV